MPFTAQELAEMRAADAEIERSFKMTLEERAYAQWLDLECRERPKNAAQQKAYYEAHKDEIAAYQKAYYEAHKDEIAAQQKAYREAHKDEIAAYQKAYREANKHKWKRYQENRKKKLEGAQQ